MPTKLSADLGEDINLISRQFAFAGLTGSRSFAEGLGRGFIFIDSLYSSVHVVDEGIVHSQPHCHHIVSSSGLVPTVAFALGLRLVHVRGDAPHQSRRPASDSWQRCRGFDFEALFQQVCSDFLSLSHRLKGRARDDTFDMAAGIPSSRFESSPHPGCVCQFDGD